MAGNKNKVSWWELMKKVFRPTSRFMAGPKIKTIAAAGDDYLICFHDLAAPLYYPREFDLQQLYQVVTEEFYPSEWHYYEVAETAITADDIVVDCGAAEGLFSLLAAPRCCQVYAIEPLPRFVASLRQTFKNFTNVEILPVGLSDQAGEAFIGGNGITAAINQDGTGQKIKLTTIDNLFFANNLPLSYLKADLEGSELAMLKGAEQTIKRYRPKIAITTYHRGQDAREIQSYLQAIVPEYKFRLKGIEERVGAPVMLHAYL